MAAVCRPPLHRSGSSAESRKLLLSLSHRTSLLQSHSPATTLARMQPPPLTPQPEWHHLPRLAPEFYRGLAVVLWTTPLEHRAKGWLDEVFHLGFRELLLHCAAREGLYCPAYVLMPEHMHVVWMGTCVSSDQR